MRYLEDLVVGAVEAFGSYELTEAEIVEIASRFDPQPWHLSHSAAADSVFGELVACASHLSCVLSALMNQSPAPMALVAGLGTEEQRLVAPGRVGDVLSIRYTVLEARPSASRPDCGVVRLGLELVDQTGRVLMTNRGAMLVGRRPG